MYFFLFKNNARWMSKPRSGICLVAWDALIYLVFLDLGKKIHSCCSFSFPKIHSCSFHLSSFFFLVQISELVKTCPPHILRITPPYILRITPYILRITPYILRITPLHPENYSLHPENYSSQRSLRITPLGSRLLK